MARELRITYQGASATLYAVIRRISDSYVWNGSAFEAWANGNIATYDIALTDRGGDLYSADWPSAMAAGDYRVIYYYQPGAAPAITDDILATTDRHWDGQAATSTSDVTISANALTSLNGLKRHLRITTSTDDTLLTECINSATLLVERVCGRNFKARDYRERYNGVQQKELCLNNFPIVHVTRIAYGAAEAMSVTYTGSDIRASAACTDTGIRLNSVSAAGVATSNHLLFADYPSCTTMGRTSTRQSSQRPIRNACST